MSKLRWGVPALALVWALASGCYPYGVAYEYGVEGELPPPEGAEIVESPPEPIVEVVPAPPFEGAVWVDGYWSWGGHRYVWIHGRYLRPPRVGLYWYPGGYVRSRRGGYVYVPGRWAGEGFRYRYRFVHPPRRYASPRYRYVPRGRRFRTHGAYYEGAPQGYVAPRGGGSPPVTYEHNAVPVHRAPAAGPPADAPPPQSPAPHRAPPAEGHGGHGEGRGHRAPPAP